MGRLCEKVDFRRKYSQGLHFTQTVTFTLKFALASLSCRVSNTPGDRRNLLELFASWKSTSLLEMFWLSLVFVVNMTQNSCISQCTSRKSRKCLAVNQDYVILGLAMPVDLS